MVNTGVPVLHLLSTTGFQTDKQKNKATGKVAGNPIKNP